MGVDYFYVNQDKGQFYHHGLFGWNGRFSALGQGPGSRALAILLSDDRAWKNDRISIIGDSSKEFDEIVLNGVDIEIEVELMLIDFDGLDWIEPRLETSSLVFTKICAFAIYLRRPDVMNMLDKKFGVGNWQGQYKKHLQGNTDTWSQKIVEAGNRGLKLLA